jgi:hypothetical protein
MRIRNDDYIRRAYERRRIRVPVVSEADFMAEEEAQRKLSLWTLTGVRLLVTRKTLDPCVSDDAKIGVTRASVDRELMRRKSATFPQRVRRRIRSLTRFF